MTDQTKADPYQDLFSQIEFLIALDRWAPKLWSVLRSRIPRAGCIPAALVSSALCRRWGIPAAPIVMRAIVMTRPALGVVEGESPAGFASWRLPGDFNYYAPYDGSQEQETYGREEGIRIGGTPARFIRAWAKEVERKGAAAMENADGWIVNIGFAEGDDDAGAVNGEWWAGHLVAIAYPPKPKIRGTYAVPPETKRPLRDLIEPEPWLIDLSIPQANRPEAGIEARPFAIPVPGDVQTEGAFTLQTREGGDGVSVAYVPNPGETSWLGSNWLRGEGKRDLDRLVDYCHDFFLGLGNETIDAYAARLRADGRM